MTIKKRDSRRSSSVELITEALLKLMKEKSFYQITIAELTKKAELSRRTFYRYFNTILEVLKYLLNKKAIEFTEFILKQPDRRLDTVVLIYFGYWSKQKDFLLLLKEHDLLPLLLDCFVPEIQEKVYQDSKQEKTIIDYSYRFICAGIWSMLIKWLEDGCTYSPEQMQKIGHNILNAVK